FRSVGVADGGRRDACPTLRFMESLLSLLRMLWDHEPRNWSAGLQPGAIDASSAGPDRAELELRGPFERSGSEQLDPTRNPPGLNVRSHGLHPARDRLRGRVRAAVAVCRSGRGGLCQEPWRFPYGCNHDSARPAGWPGARCFPDVVHRRARWRRIDARARERGWADARAEGV